MQQGGVVGGGGGSQPPQSQSQSQYGVVPPPPEMGSTSISNTPPVTAAPPPPPPTRTTHMLLGGGSGGATTDQSQQQQQLVVEEASPISSRPPAAGNLEEFMRLSSSSAGGGGGGEMDALVAAAAAGDEADRAGGMIGSGNRWPRQETLALLQIRSEMDAAFRDATLKGPLWEDVSRKLAELGYRRSAKKCKEKFENVHKYYKRTKEGRAGRQDGKSYRFFSQLEALHNITTGAAAGASSSSMPPPPPPPHPHAGGASSSHHHHQVTSLDVAPVSVGIPAMPMSSVRVTSHQQPPLNTAVGGGVAMPSSSSMFPHSATAAAPTQGTGTSYGFGFSSDGSSSTSPSSDEDDDDEDEGEELEGQPSTAAAAATLRGSRKRKRQSSSSSRGDTRRMMEFFEGLMKQVMQKQEAMQQRFLEVIEKREQDRMIREEAWKRQEMVRLSSEHELLSQERAIAASRDAAIVSFLQKITGQTIQLPTVSVPAPVPQAQSQPQPQPPPPPPQPQPVSSIPPAAVTVSTQQQPPPPQPHPTPTPPQEKQAQKQHHRQQQQQRQQSHPHHQQLAISTEVVMAIPEQQIPPQQAGSSGSFEPASSRWPKAEVLALIELRSGLESRYQESGPKGPLWEEISAGMQRMGYKRSAKRCKEKWENINKYFKKVKESNKKRPEDSKTCPYYHQLDELYRKRVIGSSSGGGSGSTNTSGFAIQSRPAEEQQQQQQTQQQPRDQMAAAKPQDRVDHPAITQASESQPKNGGGDAQESNAGFPGNLFGEGNAGATQKPEDIVKELMNQQGTTQQHEHQQQQEQQQHHQQLNVEDYDKMEEDESEEDEDEEEDFEDEDDELQDDRKKMAYKMEFQRQNTTTTATTSGASNGGGNNGAPSFLTMVQ